MDKQIYKEVVKHIKKEKRCSISYIQRVFRMDYNTATNIVNQLEIDKIIIFEFDGKIKVLEENKNSFSLFNTNNLSLTTILL